MWSSKSCRIRPGLIGCIYMAMQREQPRNIGHEQIGGSPTNEEDTEPFVRLVNLEAVLRKMIARQQ